jgi:putative membrane protein
MKRVGWLTVTVLNALGMPSAVWAQDRPWGWHPMWGHPMWGVWGLGMGFMMLTFWILVIVAVVFLVRWLAAQGRAPGADPALDILRQRYARGEINREEFEIKKQDLR